MNVIQNAVEHTKEKGIIYIDAKEHDGRLTFIVEDSGAGFTKEALLHGTEQFFMDDTSRNGEAHYGIGLFFAKTRTQILEDTALKHFPLFCPQCKKNFIIDVRNRIVEYKTDARC